MNLNFERECARCEIFDRKFCIFAENALISAKFFKNFDDARVAAIALRVHTIRTHYEALVR